MYAVTINDRSFSCATLHSAVHTYLRICKGRPTSGLAGIVNADGSCLSAEDETAADRMIDREDYEALVPMVLG
jgi:hypothetical protein